MDNETREILEQKIRDMKRASGAFYNAAVVIQNHPFIEFTGLMNEYIKACEDALKQGIDFRMCHAHSGQHLPLKPYMLEYFNEKFGCILGDRYKVVEVKPPVDTSELDAWGPSS